MTPRVDSTDWGALNEAQRIRQLEVEGYLLLPEVLATEQVQAIKRELAALPTKGTDYSENQRSCADVQWTNSPACIELIALPAGGVISGKALRR